MAQHRPGKERREPRFEAPQEPDEAALRLRPEDRPAPIRGEGRRAPQPRERASGDAPYDDAGSEPDHRERPLERERKGRGRKRAGNAASKPARHRRGFFGAMLYWGVIAGLWALIALGGVVVYHATKLPPIDQLAVPKRPPNIAILASDGSLIANRGEMGGSHVPIGELPPYVGKAFVAIEDKRFYSHFGMDLTGIARAVVRNFTSRRFHQGASTLTQQLAKNIFLTQERTLSRKVQEAMLALWLEHKYSKDQILELYMNRVYFGAGAYGIEAAAQKFFGKSARALSLGEAAVVAGLVQSPTRLAPNKNPEGAAARGALVLAQMVDQGYASADSAKNTKTNTAEARKFARPGSGNYAADWIMDILDDHIGSVEGDITVRTTLDPRLQAMAEKTAQSFEARRVKLNAGEMALVAMSPDGAVRAMIGGRDYAQSQFNRAVAAKRQPGSAFKPFVYLTALEKGLTPDTLREDSPVNIRGWKPENASHEYMGPVTLTQALALSLNTVAVKLNVEMGPKNVARTAQRLGIYSALKANESLALGTSEVSPLEMVSAYAVFANGGIGSIPHAILEVKDASGKVIYKREAQNRGLVAPPEAVASLNRMLRETLVIGTARKSDLPGQMAAGKTGTTQDYRDAWFVGYTGALVAGLWIGNDDGDPMKRVAGSGLPAELWSEFMRAALKGQPAVPPPGLETESLSLPGVAGGSASSSPSNASVSGQGLPNPGMPQAGPSKRERSLLERMFGG